MILYDVIILLNLLRFAIYKDKEKGVNWKILLQNTADFDSSAFLKLNRKHNFSISNIHRNNKR